jgi:hypothetical protein
MVSAGALMLLGSAMLHRHTAAAVAAR